MRAQPPVARRSGIVRPVNARAPRGVRSLLPASLIAGLVVGNAPAQATCSNLARVNVLGQVALAQLQLPGLVLRVDRGLPWADIAQVMLGEDAGADELTRCSAQLRKRFERLKIRLREVAIARGFDA